MRPPSRPAERIAAAALFGCGLLAITNLPAHELPREWLLAFTAPAAALGLLQGVVRRQWQRAALAALLQLGSFAAALLWGAPLSRPAALACTILPPLGFVIVRRRDADAALGLFLSFCVLLVGVILDGVDLPLIAAYGACACLALRSEAHLAASLATEPARAAPHRAVLGPVLGWSAWLVLPCLGAVFALERTLSLVPSPSRAPAAEGAARDGAGGRRAPGLDDRFLLDGAGGVLAGLHGEQLVLARSADERPVPADLYLRSGFFAVPGLDRWQIGTLELQRRPRALDHALRRPQPRTPVRWLEIERYEGARTFVFAPPHACELRGVPELQHDPLREWLRQDTGGEQTDYAIGFQPLAPPRDDEPLDPRARQLGLLALPAGLDRAPFEALLREWDATGPPLRIAARIADGLARRCRYDRQEPSGPFPHALLNFLFADGDRRGYCMHFASAAVLLLRLAGVPCRIGVGLYGGEPSLGEPGAQIYGSQHAHAWIEIPFARHGYVVVDPTPPGERGRAVSTARSGPDLPLDEPAPAPEGPGLLAGLWAFATQPWFLATLLLFALAAAMWPATAVRTTTGRAPPAARNARRLLQRLLQELAAVGHPRPRGQTLEQFARQLATRDALAPELRRAFVAYQQVRFGGRRFDAVHEQALLLGIAAATRLAPPEPAMPSPAPP